MNRRKIAAYVTASFLLLSAPGAFAQTGDTVFDECVIACLMDGGGQQGDGTLCRIVCARRIDNPPSGGGSGGGGGLPPGPRTPGCNTAGSRLCTDKP